MWLPSPWRLSQEKPCSGPAPYPDVLVTAAVESRTAATGLLALVPGVGEELPGLLGGLHKLCGP